MTLRAAALLALSLAAASLSAGCYYPPTPAYAYYPPGCVPNGASQAPSTPPSGQSDQAPPANAGTPCQLVPTYAYPAYPYYYPYNYGYYGYPGYYAYPPVSVGIGARFRL